MQFAPHLHCTFKLLRIMRIKVLSVLYKLRNLPTLFLILVNKGAIKTQLTSKTKTSLFSSAINKLLGANTWMPINILLSVFTMAHNKVSRQIGKTLLQWIEAVNVLLLAVKYRNNIVKNL